ncbi:hypothetical protein ICN48_05590 [Polynucleobacter sp. JS-Safj-400b-B2]|uniref:hypothetical protein n=1 Tax=Polynucleobacter sp. JS-Safj-400b-B2 TaxID=2576921 RepID=UPI001C0D53A5|nr:hypothetical protein [Polynucleobacter sp. JS-Safj-400b-B2]MBU3625706.1 hypothetical protein [Polynucleobacter sp. JS-Safj-400b-B2]
MNDDKNQSLQIKQDSAARINQLLEARDANEQTCPICQSKNSYVVLDRYLLLNVTDSGDPKTAKVAGSLPLIPLTCNKCGNTQLLNAFVLGVGNDFFKGNAE